jgi:hypothetical protein
MDYYEELGINSTATEDEIRKAHRRLVKLVHPDQQTDEALKQLGETQMRRLNSIVETLCDPERREEYDEQLKEGVHAFEPGALTRRPGGGRWRPLRWWAASTLGAIVLTVGAVWFWADNWGSSFGSHAPVYIPSGATEGVAADRKPAPVPPPNHIDQSRIDQNPASQTQVSREAKNRSASASPDPPSPDAVVAHRPDPKSYPPDVNSRTVEEVPAPANVKSSSASNNSKTIESPRPRRTLNLTSTNVTARSQPAAISVSPPPNVPASPVHSDAAAIPMTELPAAVVKAPEPAPPSAPAKTVAASNATKTVPADPLEGEWVYAPTQPEKRKPGFYPPEFIDLKLFSNSGSLQGQYRAKYQVTDKPISSEVNFTLTPDGSARKFLWESTNGSKGTFKISGVEGDTIRVEWRTTVYSRERGLTAGTATLVRRGQ